jgi:hypothetical protein
MLQDFTTCKITLTGTDRLNSRFLRPLSYVSRTRSTVSADGPGRPVRFSTHRQPLCRNVLYHARIVLSIGGSVWYKVQNLRCTVTIDSVLANSRTQNTFLSPAHVIFRHNCLLAVNPASTPWRITHLESFSIRWYAPFCCVCLGYCTAEFGNPGRTYD